MSKSPAIVYVVTSGEYSDYTIEGVFSTRELAEKFAAQWGDCNDIAEWPLDKRKDESRKIVHQATIRADTGDVDKWFGKHSYLESSDNDIKRTFYYDRSNEIIGESSISPDHALKLAAEKRQEILRAKAAKP